jgi:hypothetical protein
MSEERVLDYDRDPKYERRLVVFYDFLGWRSEIISAGSDPKKIGRLRRMLLLHSRLLKIDGPVTVTTFSDNVVISTVPDKDATPIFLDAIATLQLHASAKGFLMRGGVAVGDLIHDSEVVFGPALNRAYELESKIAIYPRIVVDDEVVRIGNIGHLLASEEGVHFLDPFTTAYFGAWLASSKNGEELNATLAAMGLPGGAMPGQVHGATALMSVLDVMKPRIRVALADKEFAKVAWLYDRIARRLGVPLTASYPRIRPQCATP